MFIKSSALRITAAIALTVAAASAFAGETIKLNGGARR